MTKRNLFPALLMALACAVLILGATDFAHAKRFGGGRSFGSKPLFSSPARRPAPAQQGIGTQQTQRNGALGGAGLRRPGMGGMLGGLLMGGLIGSLFFGGGFGGINFMDLLIIGGLIWLGSKLLSRRSSPARGPGQRGTGQGAQADDEVGPREATDAYRRAQVAWDMVRSNPARESASGQTDATAQADVAQAPMPQGFDAEEFLEGAKMCFTRLQQSWSVRDVEDVSQFTTPTVLAEITRQMEDDPEPSPVEVLMVNARILEVTEEGAETHATVYYDVLLREQDAQDRSQSQPQDVREVWHFLRDTSEEHPMWRLDGIQQVQ